MNDAIYIQRCFDLAQNGTGQVSPNPMVGAVIVCAGKIIGEGWHRQYGGPHAEVLAVQSVRNPELLPQATLYCSLEPCHHFGKTPPCVDLILNKKIPRVVIANMDPNPLVAGQSIRKMREHGVAVTTGVLEEQGQWLNRAFFTWIQQQRPYIILKWAQSKDGYIGKKGEQTAISGPATQRLVHRWRSETDAMLVGTQTALIDNPRLNNRYFGDRQPLRIALDWEGKIPAGFHLLDDSQPTWIIGKERAGSWENTRFVNLEREHMMPALLQELYFHKKATLLVEGGAALLNAFLEQGDGDEIRVITNDRHLGDGVQAPALPVGAVFMEQFSIGMDSISIYRR
jgi:diaminohydroxyphosphoribosylaminopyrimidine deaminase/5-amino-6-(5-phosphoribosylamino)uracil reductase